MDVNEKREKYLDFIKSDSFTLPSYSALSLFSINIRKMDNLIKSESKLLSGLLEKENYSMEEFRDFGFVQLDILCKIMMMIEGVCALATSLEKGRKYIANGLTYYKPKLVSQLRKKLDSYSDEQKEEFMKKTLSLPNLDLLDYLSKDEKDFLNEILRETSQINYARLVGAINFYLSHQIAYNKFKHGLSFVPSIPSTMKNSKNAYAIALHHSKNSPPHKANLLIAKESFFQKEYDCYNTAGIMRVNEKTLQKYLAISESIDDFAQFITQNNCIACENCEQDFLPLKVLKDKKNVEPWLYLYPPTKERIKKIYEIYRKAMPHIFVVTKRQGKYEFNFSKEVGEQIEKHLDHIGMAVAWFENR